MNESIINERACESLGHDYIFLRECEHIPDVYFFSVILYLLTFFISITLRDIKTSSFLSASVRNKLSNFGVVITISLMVMLDYWMGLDTPKLHVPSEFHPTIPDRGWFINPITRNPNNWIWLSIFAIPPALLATILIFMDQQITAVLINRKSNKLEKSSGYHLDLAVCNICILINSFLGLPWFVAATVLSMNHVMSLKKVSSSTVPGVSAKIVGIIEQRVSGLVIFILIGSSIFVAKYLTYIPMPVLYAVFLYMGITPLGELEIYHRIQLFFTPQKYQHDNVYLRAVRLKRIHLFTLIQILCICALYVIKMNKTLSITFPLMVN
jgi:hypothetical protein